MAARDEFGPDFFFGVGSSAFQIEGAWDEDGKGESVWDRFTHRRRRMARADRACDHYHRRDEDIDLLAWLGVNAYRFSVSWPRIQPRGTGAPNPRGLDFYDRLVDGLLARDIEPFVTLFHWDLPQALETRLGGFQSPETARLFGDYAELVAGRIADRVRYFITLNEPSDYSIMGNLLGMHAPGRRGFRSYFRSVHNQLLAHGHAVAALRAVRSDLRVGYSPNFWNILPAQPEPRHRRAARVFREFMNTAYVDPLFFGAYPADLYRRFGRYFPDFGPDDFSIISRPIDFLGINTYTRQRARHLGLIPLFHGIMDVSPIPKREYRRGDRSFTAMGWEVHPESMRDVLHWAWERYGRIPLHVTESGAAYADDCPSGYCRDYGRAEYLRRYLAAVHQARREGVDVRGYFAWTFMDNFEWSFGYDKRFGLVHVDFDSLKRTPKYSGHWYRAFLQRRVYSLSSSTRDTHSDSSFPEKT